MLQFTSHRDAGRVGTRMKGTVEGFDESGMQVRLAPTRGQKRAVDVSVSDNAVTIKASTHHEKEEGEPEGAYFPREIASGSFSRTVPLPGNVDADRAKTSFENGILEITLPKVEASRRRQIPVV